MKNVVMLVLPDTLMGLYQAHTDGTILTTGSAFVLQVWIMELLDLFIHPVHLRSPFPYDRLESYHLFEY